LVELSDEELCRRIAGRDALAFDLLVERHQARVYRLARSMLGNDADARDASQEAFIRLYRSAHRFDGRARFTTWFYRILVNLCIDHQRRGRWWRNVLPLGPRDDNPDAPAIDPPSPERGPDLEAIRGESIGRLRAALARLAPNQRAALLLQVQEGLSSREIAAALNCSENTARVHIHRAIVQLRKALKKDD
jgi:RNA polymerase sigma-70 factor, ECF subfamily